jgi:hypothetical protein
MTEATVRAYAAEKHFGAATIERWLALPPPSRDALLELTERLRLGENQFRDVLDDLTAIAARQSTTIAAIVASADVAAVLARGQGRNESVKALKVALRRLRYPQLAAAERRLRALTRALRLPAGVDVALPENLEGDAVTMTLRGRSAAELRAQARSLVAALAGQEIEEMFAVLEGRW